MSANVATERHGAPPERLGSTTRARPVPDDASRIVTPIVTRPGRRHGLPGAGARPNTAQWSRPRIAVADGYGRRATDSSRARRSRRSAISASSAAISA